MQFTGIDDFDAQLRAFLNTLISEIADAEESALSEAQESLKKHIVEDVYQAYSPTVYKRRSNNNGLGTPLSDLNAYSQTIPPAGGNVNGKLMVTSRLYYNPKGAHQVKKWSSGASNKKGIVNVDDNQLISRIEKKDPAYNWGNDAVPPRPFWQNFINEMVTNKELENAFVWAMSTKEDIVADGNIVEDPHDRDY